MSSCNVTNADEVDVRGVLRYLEIEHTERHGEAWALCPAHDDRRPSWSVNLTSGRHHCFSCGWGGGVVALVIRALGADRIGWTHADAWKWLNERGLTKEFAPGLDVEMELVGGRPASFRLPNEVRFVPFEAWPAEFAEHARGRRLTGAQVEKWGIGVATEGRLRNRIVFPVRDRAKRICSYTARTIERGDVVRYLTPSEGEHASKTVLWGEECWPEVGMRGDLVLAEGVFDALAIERAVECRPYRQRAYVAAVLGASRATSPLVLAKLATWGRITAAFDSDAAGVKAFEELRNVLGSRVVSNPVPFPKGVDADMMTTYALRTLLDRTH